MTTATAAKTNTPAEPTQGKAAPALKAVPERKVQPIEEARIKSGDFVRSFYMATAFENTEPTDLLKPEYWAHFAQKLRLRDRIEVWANDGSWVADVVVLGASKNSADVRVLRVDYIDNVQPSGEATSELKSYDVRYRGIHSQWSVIRVADGAVVHEGDGSRAAADTWLTNHLKAFK
jgi:hypothetical protein